jgi:PBP1b-binding outer membrane lipoprotein LpoB
MYKVFASLLIGALFFTACVSQKKFTAAANDYKHCQEEIADKNNLIQNGNSAIRFC